MLYKSLYNGPKIDELLEAIGKIKKVDNGWVKMNSSEENPIDFNDLINPGNYSFDYWVNSPEGKDYPAPVNVVVTQENGKIRQYIFSLGYNSDAYSRLYDQSTKTFDSWVDESITPGLTFGDTPPENPNPNDLWFNTSNSDAVIQYFDSATNSWKSLNPDDYMDPSIYNPDGLTFENGIYNWIIEKTTNLTGGDSPVDFTEHINNNTIHLTKDEKTDIDSKPIKSELIQALNVVADELTRLIATQVSQTGIDMGTYETLINNIVSSLTTHSEDSVKHPSTEQINDWNNKSEVNHTHDISSIEIDVSDIVGEYTMSMLPDSIRERQVQVNDEAGLLALTINEVQNGDFVYIVPTVDPESTEESNGNMLYIVTDDTKLGTIDAFTCLSTPPREVTWDEITNKPTSIEELGCTNYSNTQIDDFLTDLNKSTTEVTDIVTSIESKLNMKDYSHYMETLIDIIDNKMQFINKNVYE